jgi:hypothetical protein
MLLVGSFIAVGLLAQAVDAGVGASAAELRNKNDKKKDKKTDKKKDKKTDKNKGKKNDKKKGKKTDKNKGKDKAHAKDKAHVKDKGKVAKGPKGKNPREHRRVALTHARFGLPKHSRRLAPFGARRVYKTGPNGQPLKVQPPGYPRTVTDNYTAASGESVQTSPVVEFASVNASNQPVPLPFKAGVYGKVIAPLGGPQGAVTLQLANGMVVQYLYTSARSVPLGASVTPTTTVGNTGSTGTDSIRFAVQAKDQTGAQIDPEIAFAAGSQKP